MGSADVTKVDEHRAALVGLTDWMPYLDAHSGLPGPRGNLELVAACGEEADIGRAEELISTGDEFATVCGLVALGRHLAPGDDTHVALLHRYASDDRWRVREGIAMALQRLGDDDLERAFGIAEEWATDPDPLVRRAAVAAVCEPRLLRDPSFARRALALLERTTSDLAASPATDRRSTDLRTLRQALGYGWSVAIAALPDDGLVAFERLKGSDDGDVGWIVRENKKKARLRRLLGGES
jgi:HEAT repeats